MMSGKTTVQSSQVNLSAWQAYIEQLCGFVLPSAQNHWLSHAISKTANAYGLTSQELYQILMRDAQDSKMIQPATQSLLDNILIAESRFFRHEPSINFIGRLYKNSIMNNKERGRNDFLVWSVGCSTGQEVYSVAMTLHLIFRQLSNPISFMVNGSDLSSQSLKVAQKGVYDGRQVAQIPTKYRTQLLPISNENKPSSEIFNHQKHWRISEKIGKHTRFFLHNAFNKSPVDLPKQDVIICQNMLIYFRKFDQRDILAYFVQHLAVGGYLLLAPNEAILWQHPNMKRVENNQINAWQKIRD